MNDDLKFNNIPSAELEKISQGINQKNDVGEGTSVQSDSKTELESNVETSTAASHAAENTVSKQVEQTSDSDSEYTNKDNMYSQASPRTNTLRNNYNYPTNTESNNGAPRVNTVRNRQQYPPNTSPNNGAPRVNTVRNRHQYPPNSGNNVYSQNGQQYPPYSGSNNGAPHVNTVRNKYQYPPNVGSNVYYQNAQQYPSSNGYQYQQNANNMYQQYNNRQNGYQYPPNANNAYAQNNPYYPNQVYAPPQYYYEPSPKELEKLALSKDASTAGKTTIAIYIVMFIVAIIITAVATLCGVVQDVPDLENDPYAGFTPMGFYMYEGLTSLLSVFLPALIIIKASGKKITELIPFKKVKGKTLFSIVMCGMSLCMVAQLMATLIGVNFSLFGIDIYEGLETATATGVFDLIMSAVCTAVIPALVEEFAYRGLVLGILKGHDEMLAVFGSAFLFGMLHGNLGQIPFAFVVGLILGYVRVKTDSMLPGILIHFGNNFYAVVITILGEILPEPYSSIVDAAVILVLIVAGFIATSYLAKNEKDLFKVEKKQSYLTYKEKLNVFLKTGTVIASIVILSIMSLVVLFVV